MVCRDNSKKHIFVNILNRLFEQVITDPTSVDYNKTSKCYSLFIHIGEDINYFENICDKHVFYDALHYDECPTTYELCSHMQNKINSFNKIERSANVIVFDLDDTLISEHLELFYKSIFSELAEYKNVFDYVVLWTHGTEDYLNQILCKLKWKFTFDIMIARKRNVELGKQNKGMSAVLRELNTTYGITNIKFGVLVDDKQSNFIGDYDVMLWINSIPTTGFYARSLAKIKQEYENYINNKSVKSIIT